MRIFRNLSVVAALGLLAGACGGISASVETKKVPLFGDDVTVQTTEVPLFSDGESE